jgi:hypothetical protein
VSLKSDVNSGKKLKKIKNKKNGEFVFDGIGYFRQTTAVLSSLSRDGKCAVGIVGRRANSS